MESESQDQQAIDVYTMLTAMVDQMAGIAWMKMGLQADLMTGKVEKDIDQARLAIDVVEDLCARIEPKLDEADRTQLQNLKRDLKINFVQQSQRGD